MGCASWQDRDHRGSAGLRKERGLRPKNRPSRKFSRRLYSAAPRTFKRHFARPANTFRRAPHGLEVAADVAAPSHPTASEQAASGSTALTLVRAPPAQRTFRLHRRMRRRRRISQATADPASAPTPTTATPAAITIGKMVPGPSAKTAVISAPPAPATNASHPLQTGDSGHAKRAPGQTAAATTAITMMPAPEFRNHPLPSIVGRVASPATRNRTACAAANATAPASTCGAL